MANLTLYALLSRGYLPRELPPPFQSISFARFANRSGASLPKNKWSSCVYHNLARPAGLRRPLGIPNPVAYYWLAKALTTDWKALKQHTESQRLSLSRPFIAKKCSRAVAPRYKLRERDRMRALRRRSSKYLLLADISQFYPSIYTHAVSWALHTKALSKESLTNTKLKKATSLGDGIDKALQCSNEGQTHGIPIGPDASLVVAEVLLTAVDAELAKRLGPTLRGYRYVDDYELSFDSLSHAEEALAVLQHELAEFGLLLNPRKTRIDELPQPISSSWVRQLGTISIAEKESPVRQRNDILALFSEAYMLAPKNEPDSVLRYAVTRSRHLDVHPHAWRTYCNCVLGAASADAATLPHVLGALFEVAKHGGHEVPTTPLGEVLESIIRRHAPRAQGSEVAWALWGALAWSIPLGNDAARLVSNMNDDVVALLALHLDSRHLFPKGALNKTNWAATISTGDAFVGEHWLLAYEACRTGWLPIKVPTSERHFAQMLKSKVRFYDRRKRKPEVPEAAAPLPGGTLWWNYA